MTDDELNEVFQYVQERWKKLDLPHWMRPEWPGIVLRVLNLFGFICQWCSRPGTLEDMTAHHMSYAHIDEPEEHLSCVALHKTCHRELHELPEDDQGVLLARIETCRRRRNKYKSN